jgi:hypothetical protein
VGSIDTENIKKRANANIESWGFADTVKDFF